MMNRIKEIRDNTETEAAFMDHKPECNDDHHPGCDCQIQRHIKEKLDLLREINSLRNKLENIANLVLDNITAPDADCHCHLCAPCSDCVEYGGIRALLKEAGTVIVSGIKPSGA